MASDTDSMRAIGHAVLALVNAAILLAILAVVLAPGSQAASSISSFFALLAWLVGQVVQPITGGGTVQITPTPAPEGGYGMTSTATGATTTTGLATGTAAAPTGTTGAGNAGNGTVVNLCDNATGAIMGQATLGFGNIPAGMHMC